jgi:hypothetical protein
MREVRCACLAARNAKQRQRLRSSDRRVDRLGLHAAELSAPDARSGQAPLIYFNAGCLIFALPR